MPLKNFSLVRRKLLHWYEKHQRDLPWRKTRDPYAIWISETMLQQTQVKTVLPYYDRFLKRLPTVEALAHAPLDRVLHLWSGLGYYRRARYLKKAARQIMRYHGGKLPRQYRELRALAGIGDYTAGALLSIAFGQNQPAIDGNVKRVLGRLCSTDSAAQIRTAALRLVTGNRPGELNQALMELGATVCGAKAPQCNSCPLKRECSFSQGRIQVSRNGSRRLKLAHVTWPLAIVHSQGRILLRRRSGNQLLERLWEIPGGEVTRPEEASHALRQQLRDLPLGPSRRIGEIRHSITYRRIRAPIYLFNCAESPTPLGRHWRWVSASRSERYPISAMTKKALAVFAGHEAASAK